MVMNFFSKKYWFLLLGITLSSSSFALDEYGKQWLAVNYQQAHGRDKQWLSFVYSQLRIVDQSNPWQAVLVEGGVGYHFFPLQSIWMGYRWTGRNLYNDFFQENRIFQQLILQKRTDKLHLFIFRTRLEEITQSNNHQIALRLRQRFGMEIHHALLAHAFPFIYDELFFQLNQPSYVPQRFLGENRLFLGFNLYRTKTSWWEIGYMNQYQIHNAQQTQNQMSHILSVTYNFT
jgi:hypothetical protein